MKQVTKLISTEVINRIRPCFVNAASVCSRSTPYSVVRDYKTIATAWHSAAFHPVIKAGTVQPVVAHRPVVAFNTGVLLWITRLDEINSVLPYTAL